MTGQAIILGLLMKSSLTGYQIKEIITSRLNHFYGGGYGMIYPTLKKLEQKGLVVGQVITQTDKPNKNVFTITDSGRTVFEQAVRADINPDLTKNDYLMRMYFGEFLDESTLKKFTEVQMGLVQAKLADLEKRGPEWRQQGMSAGQIYTYEYGIRHYSGELQQLAETLATFKP
ncbi:PadR family transcriptional regulator [Leuconostocaceae bacterium ESL0723]|nr:PadR family transcriptional regulator [Leuconostocaceae bacterium ESL0723]